VLAGIGFAWVSCDIILEQLLFALYHMLDV
jgi:hypothetical protein